MNGSEFKLNVRTGLKTLEGSVNLKELKEARKEESMKSLQEIATNHPNINKIKEILQGEIINVTIEDKDE